MSTTKAQAVEAAGRLAERQRAITGQRDAAIRLALTCGASPAEVAAVTKFTRQGIVKIAKRESTPA